MWVRDARCRCSAEIDAIDAVWHFLETRKAERLSAICCPAQNIVVLRCVVVLLTVCVCTVAHGGLRGGGAHAVTSRL